MRQACAEYATQPVFRKEVWSGLRDLTSLIESSIEELLPKESSVQRTAIEAVLAQMFEEADHIGAPETWSLALERFSNSSEALLHHVKTEIMDQDSVQSSDLSYEVFDALDLLDHRVSSLRSAITCDVISVQAQKKPRTSPSSPGMGV